MSAGDLSPAPSIRDAEDADSDGLITLIGGVFAEYPGCVLDVDGEIPELRAPATSFRAWGGQLWVAELDGLIVACGGFRASRRALPAAAAPEPSPAGRGIELCKLYVGARARKRGLGGALCARVEDAARARGAAFVELWSDTRFEDAHRLYDKRGYLRGSETRVLHDLSDSVEYYFRLELLDAAADGSR